MRLATVCVAAVFSLPAAACDVPTGPRAGDSDAIEYTDGVEQYRGLIERSSTGVPIVRLARETDANAVNARGWVVGEEFLDPVDPLRGWVYARGEETFLTGPVGGNGEARPVDINNRGELVGDTPFLDDRFPQRGFLWRDGEYVELDRSRAASGATAVNDRGQVVGFTRVGGTRFNAIWQAALWQGGERRVLGTLAAGWSSAALDINNRGRVVGYSRSPESELRPFLWDRGRMTSLGTPPGWSEGIAEAINDAGMVLVGVRGSPGSFLLRGDDWTLLPGIVAEDLNNRGQVVGGSPVRPTESDPGRAVLWERGVVTDLGTLVGHRSSWARAMNDAGVVVGTSTAGDGTFYAVLWLTRTGGSSPR